MPNLAFKLQSLRFIHSIRYFLRSYSRFLLLGLVSMLMNTTLMSQSDEDIDRIVYSINLDSTIVIAAKAGFDIKDFIKMVQSDTTFYQGFKNLRTATYDFDNDIRFFDRKGNIKASYNSNTRQISDGRCRRMTIQNELSTGRYYTRKKKLNYYTSKLYERLFFTQGTECESPASGKSDSRGMEKHIDELKKLIFQPGQKANVPLIGGKTAIFSKRLSKYYDFDITSTIINNKNCYAFIAQMKPDIIQNNPDIGVVKYLSTYFEKGSLQIVKRRYLLSNSTLAYSFKVEMDVDMINHQGLFYPHKVRYDGTWKIPTQKREQAHFLISFDF